MFDRLWKEQLEAQVRTHGPLAVLRDLMQTMCILRHDVDADTAWEYGALIAELQALVIRNTILDEAKRLGTGANNRLAA